MGFLPIDEDLSGISRIDAAQNFHERRLTGTVFPHNGMQLARFNLETDIGQRFNARKGLGKMFEMCIRDSCEYSQRPPSAQLK